MEGKIPLRELRRIKSFGMDLLKPIFKLTLILVEWLLYGINWTYDLLFDTTIARLFPENKLEIEAINGT